MQQYHDLMTRILDEGATKADRTGTGTTSVFGHQMRFDLRDGFPLVTTKKVHFRSVVEELLWMLRGETNVRPLQEKGVTIWNEWADENGELGPVYGKQWRRWESFKIEWVDGEPRVKFETIDQVANVIAQLRTNPDSRRIIVSAWNPGEVDDMKLPPCHMLFQFYSREMTREERIAYAGYDADQVEAADDVDMLLGVNLVPTRILSCQLYQRSADVFLGVPFNIASYALLLTLIAREVGMAPGEFVWTGGDTHLYANHIEQARLQLTREPRPLPTLSIRPGASFDRLAFEDFTLTGYDPHPPIKADVAV